MSKFQRRHYEFLARVCGQIYELSPKSVETLISALAAENGHFKPERFRKFMWSGR